MDCMGYTKTRNPLVWIHLDGFVDGCQSKKTSNQAPKLPKAMRLSLCDNLSTKLVDKQILRA